MMQTEAGWCCTGPGRWLEWGNQDSALFKVWENHIWFEKKSIQFAIWHL